MGINEWCFDAPPDGLDPKDALINPVGSLWTRPSRRRTRCLMASRAYAFTRSAPNVDRLAEGVEAGSLSINHFVASIAETPFGGVKENGHGGEGGTERLECYAVAKNVSHLVM